MIVYKSMVCKINPYSAVFLLFLFQAGAVHTLISRNGEDRLFDSAGSFSKDTAKDLPCGEIILSVKCTQNPEQTYALYIPLHYESEKKWPIVYVFDPAAHGSIPVELMKEAAERYGFIIAASNNSRNGHIDLQQKAGRAMWDDTHARLAVDNDCVYFAGFSGGARMAALLAQECACVQGILLNSAGFSPYSPPSAKDRFAVFLTAGMSDFNYDEIIKLEKTLGNLGISHFLRRFNGSHGWAPKAVWQEAFAWMRLVAIRNGRQSHDAEFIAKELDLSLHRAQTLEDSGSTYYAWQNYREVSDVFHGLADTKKIDARTTLLENDVKVREGREREEKDLDEQIKLQNNILSILQLMQKPKPKWLTGEQLNNYDEGGFTFGDLRSQARDAIQQLQKDMEFENRPERRRVLDRVHSIISVYLSETAQSEMDSNDFEIAKIFYEFAVEAQPEIYGPHLSLARCLIRLGDKEESIHELSRARETGLSAQALSDLLKQMTELNSLTGDPEFQKLITAVPSGH